MSCRSILKTFLGIWNPSSLDVSEALKLDFKTKTNVDMNLNMILSEKENVKLSDDSYVLFQTLDGLETSILTIKDGNFHVPGDSEGTLIFPLQNLEISKDFAMESIGFIFVLPENRESELTITDIEYVKNPIELKILGTQCELVGEMNAEIPTQGNILISIILLQIKMSL